MLKRLERILGVMGFRENLGLLEQLFKPRGKKPIEISISEEKELENQAEDIIKNVEREIEDKIRKFDAIHSFLHQIRSLKIDIEDLRSTNRLFLKLGSIIQDDISSLENELKSKIKNVLIYTDGKKRAKFIVLISQNRFSSEIEEILSKYTFEDIILPDELSGFPRDSLRMLDSQSISIFKKHEKEILCLYDVISSKIERLKIKEKMGKTNRIFVLEGWIPENKTNEIIALIKKVSNGNSSISVSPARDELESEVPTLLKKRKLISSFAMLTEMYGIPKYNEIDPTPFLALFFSFFIGLMSADIAIGLTLLIGSILIRRGAGSRSKNMKDLSFILLCIGLSTILFGILMGEFMGNLIELPVIWISGADEPIEFLLIVIALGLIHITLGVFLGLIKNVYDHNIRKIIGDQLSILLMISSAIFFLLTGEFAFQGINILGYTLGIIGLIALIIGKGPFGLLELTKLLSNSISYVRIMAINMATAWMNRTFVLLGGLLLDIYILGPFLDGFLLLFSHLFIVFISIFATFAHSLRLHYVEFFGRFFIGGGVKFSPLQSNREYTILKDKNEGKKIKILGEE
jgi:V/A-type H+-transporting ATPase subunit I